MTSTPEHCLLLKMARRSQSYRVGLIASSKMSLQREGRMIARVTRPIQRMEGESQTDLEGVVGLSIPGTQAGNLHNQ